MDQTIVPINPGLIPQIDTTSHSQHTTANSLGNFDVNTNYYLEDMNSDDIEELSPIELIIRVPMVVTGDENRVTADPSASANRIAIGIMHALKTVSINGIGMPMIDENGRPRPIKIDIMADIKIDGSRNMVGEAATLNPVSSELTNEPKMTKVANNEIISMEQNSSKDTPAIDEAHDDSYFKRRTENTDIKSSEVKKARRS